MVTSNEGCKKDLNVERFFSRTAGMIYLFRPCGISLSHCEMYTAESLTQVFSCLVNTFGTCPNNNELRSIVYDRSCDLDPFIQKLSLNGNHAAQNYKDLIYIVDIFHVEKHSSPKCILKSQVCK